MNVTPMAALSLLQRYWKAHLALTGPLVKLPGGGQARACFRNERLQVTGQRPTELRDTPVELTLGTLRQSARPDDGDGSFSLELPWPDDLPLSRAALLACGSGEAVPLPLPAAAPARLRLSLRLGRILLGGVPDILRWRRHGDHAARTRIKAALGFSAAAPAGRLAPETLETPAPEFPALAEGQEVTLVIPVYNAFDVLQLCLERVSRHTSLPWHAVLVEDRSSDPRVRPFLRDWAQAQGARRVTLLEHEENLGFIGAVNHGLETALARGDQGPVILLNTDALVPEAWSERLIAPLLADPQVASVTPMSNDAEIFCVPTICAPLPLAPGVADAIDVRARSLGPGTEAEAPTGVGFCMALSRTHLKQLPRLDPAFGRGYGEEVDWCQKIRTGGGRHLGTARLFVEHRSGSSFGSADKLALVQANGRIISSRYPRYDAEVQNFILTDPMRAPRLALGMAWAAATAGDRPLPIYLAHSLGGGAEHWLLGAIASDLAEGLPSVVLRIGGAARWQVELHSSDGVTAGWCDAFALVESLLSPLTRRRIIYSCGVGDRDPASLPRHLLALKRNPEDHIEVLLHDYFPLSPAFTLLDGQGTYRGAITPERLATLPPAAAAVHVASTADGEAVDLATWQRAWGDLLACAGRIRVFDPSSAALLEEVWPGLSGRIEVTPHEMSRLPGKVTPAHDAPPVLGVLGNIAPHKGAALVQRLARMNTAERGGDLVLMGNIDPDYPLPRRIRLHGNYDPADIPHLAAHYGITHWLIPSVWPETFSFTTREALATGLPVLAFDIGAQGEAVRRADNGHPLPYAPEAGPDGLARIVVEGFHGAS